MQYHDDGITLNYDLLKTTFPLKKGWTKFLKTRPNRTGKEDYVYYSKHRGGAKPFNPPVITDSINLTNRSFLTPTLDVEEEYKLHQTMLQNQQPYTENSQDFQAISNDALFRNKNTSNGKNGWTKEAEGFYSPNSSKDGPRGSNGFHEEFGSQGDKENGDVYENKILGKKIGKAEKPEKKRNKRAGKFVRKNAEEPKSIPEQEMEMKENGVEGKYLRNRIPSFLEEYENQNMYSINRRFYFNPINPSL